MEITNIFINVAILVLSGGAAGYGLFVWFRKKRIGHSFAKNLENPKAELNRTSNDLNEKLRIEYGSLY